MSKNERSKTMPKEASVRARLNMLRPIVDQLSLETVRSGQEKIGSLLSRGYLNSVTYSPCYGLKVKCLWALPVDETRNGVVLYIHGGGFTCGDLEYAKGFGSMIAHRCGVRTLCVSYRLAPESPFPAALDDCFEAYKYLIDSGYSPESIVLAGESSGGGLCFSLGLRLKAAGMEMPAGIIAVSPWCDLSLSSESCTANAKTDVSMNGDKLRFFADCYSKRLDDPYVSPVFGEYGEFCPTLIFAGGGEILLDDSVRMHNKLLAGGNESELVVRDGLWHAYLLYSLKEYHEQDMALMNDFLDKRLKRKKLGWLKLDNAAKIYPAARTRTWSNVFRLAATLDEQIEPAVLKSALDVTVRRFPSIAVRLRRGVFWYYLEEIRRAPEVIPEKSCPLTRMVFDDISTCAFRVLYYKNRVAVEFFHSLTDGTGGTVFLKTLIAEYLGQKKGIFIEPEKGVLDRLEKPSVEELEDGFLLSASDYAVGDKQENAYRLKGAVCENGYLNVTTGVLSVAELKKKAAEYKVSVTVYLAAVMAWALVGIRSTESKRRSALAPVTVQVPVNLRRFCSPQTLRNFAYFVNLSVDPRKGDYSFDEIVKSFHHQLALGADKKELVCRFSSNVKTERVLALRVMPLFIKNLAMKAAYKLVGEKSSSICMTNLGGLELPEKMLPYIKDVDFVIGARRSSACNCAIISLQDKMVINLSSVLKDSEFERRVFTHFVKNGVGVYLRSNRRE